MMNSQRVDTIKNWPTPMTFQNVQIFLEFVNFYRRFIEAYLRIASPLTGLLKGSKNEKKTGLFKWLEDAEKAFNYLKKAFTTAPVLVHFDSELKN